MTKIKILKVRVFQIRKKTKYLSFEDTFKFIIYFFLNKNKNNIYEYLYP